jgi:copper homeostasis protein
VPPLFESCVDSLDTAAASGRGGAGRIELCARLDVGGTTPDPALVARCVGLGTPVCVMIRPRAGDFVYDRAEVEAMAQAIRTAAAAGAAGVVFGAMRFDGTIDAGVMQRLLEAAHPLPVTCHKAIDATRDPLEALEALIALGIDRVLTSGGAATAAAGAGVIARMVARAGDALTVMAGGGVRADGVADLVRRTGVREVHARLLPVAAPPADPATLEAWERTVRGFVERTADPVIP